METERETAPAGVLIISQDAVGARRAGPAIRDWEWAGALGRSLAVTLAVPAASGMQPAGFTLRVYHSGAELRALASAAGVVVISGYLLRRYPWLGELSCPLVVDLSHSFVLESMQTLAQRPEAQQWSAFGDRWRALNELLLAGDYFVCNTERQRDYWLGMLSALGRVNPAWYAADPAMRQLVGVVPFGLPAAPPRKTRPVLKGAHPSIRAGDKVIYWGGGIYDWLDPVTLIRATDLVRRQRDDVRVVFTGVRHPNPHVPPMRMLAATQQLSRQLGLTDRCVFFYEWLPYADRADYLLEADVGASLHLDHLETRYAFRTRALDYLWAGLPIVCSEGDALAELVARHRLGRVVPYQDAPAVAAALLALLDQPGLRQEMAPRFQQVAAGYTWEVTTRPLLEFCRQPRLAPDRGRRLWSEPAAGGGALWQERLSKGWQLLRQQGALALGREVLSFWRWQRGR